MQCIKRKITLKITNHNNTQTILISYEKNTVVLFYQLSIKIVLNNYYY